MYGGAPDGGGGGELIIGGKDDVSQRITEQGYKVDPRLRELERESGGGIHAT